MESISILWFKRDLRLHDHEPLKKAIETGLPVLLLYCFEPTWMAAPDSDVRHWRFVWESIQDMQKTLEKRGLPFRVVWAHKEVVEVFERLQKEARIDHVFSHEETGNAITFERDKAVAQFCRLNFIQWHETPANGITRRLYHREGWEKTFVERMERPLQNPDLQQLIPFFPKKETLLFFQENQLPKEIQNPNPVFQPGGESYAFRYMESFFSERHRQYFSQISKPTEARLSCSRLSPYIAWGCLSIRQIWHETEKAMNQGGSAYPLQQFRSRLFWQSHFVQKFETECRIEFENMNRGFDLIRNEVDEAKVEAWKNGQTGFPLVDASMRCAMQTGYLNFRMRSMLVSFLTHHLWQPWQAGVHHLAKIWLDYEPGIHYCQFQMQAGTMGVNTVRIYNPVKQAHDHDPEAVFIKKWLPELQNLPAAFAIEPWKMTEMEQTFFNVQLGKDYPKPIVDLAESGRYAREQLWAHKKHEAVRAANRRILSVHTKRKKAEETTVMGDPKTVENLKKARNRKKKD